MRIKSFLVPLIVGTIFLSSCSRNAVGLTYTNAKGEVPLLGNLVFRFDQAMIKDSLLNNWDSTEYIAFEPSIKGRFRWQSPDELVFSPAQPLNPATNYKAEVKKALLRYSKYDVVKGGDEIEFHTPDLALENSQVIWIGESGTTAVPQLDLYFNYKIDPAKLKDRMSLESGGKKLDYSAVTITPDSKISVRLNGVKSEDKDFDVKITIEKGLKPIDGSNATDENLVTTLSVPSPFVLTIQNLEAEHDGLEGVVRIVTSQQMGAENIKSFVKIKPEVNFTIEPMETGFAIRSDKFDMENSYSITIAKGMRGKIGGVLKDDYYGDVAFGELEAGISFNNSKAVYLSKKGGKNIEIKITNVNKVKVVISKVYENNLLAAERYGYQPQETMKTASYRQSDDEGEDYYERDYYYDSYNNSAFGDVIFEKEIDTRSLPKSAGGRLLNFSQFEDRLQDFKGVYHILIRSEKDYWVRDSRFISLSDLGLIAKQGEEKILVFANSIKTANAAEGVSVSVYGANNQLIGTASTNNSGVAEIAYARKDFAGFKPAMVIARTADDFNYLPFNNTRVNTSRFEVGGKRNNASGLDAFIYAERDIYRPGEKLNYSVIIRDRQWKSPGDILLKLKFLLPNGKELKTLRRNLNEEGSVDGSLEIANSAITGSYTLEVYTSNDIFLGSQNFSVEEFVPDRIRVNTKLDKAFLKPGMATSLAINAMNFFGPPAGNRKYETEIQVKQKNFSPEKYGEYDFNLAIQSGLFTKEVKEGKTDDQGNATVEFTTNDDYANRGLLQANFYTTVFDETGRPVSRASAIDIYTQDVFNGIKYDPYYYYPLNQPVQFELTSVNKDGNPIASSAKVKIIKHEYRTVLSRSGGYFRYESQQQDLILAERDLNIGANTSYAFIPRSPGNYELRVYRPGSNNYVSRSFYSYGSWGSNNNSFEVNNEGNISISLDKKSYLAGEKVTALFKAPFNGRMLVTVETDHVISYQYVDVNNRTASLDLSLTGEHVPNAYITATLIKPHEMSDIPLTVAHGFQNVKVEEKSRKIPVQITAQKTVRSRTNQKITVKASPNSYVTLAAVDNGVLQVSDFKTPDPYNYFYQKKALQVSAYDLYPLLFAEVKASLSSTGGDGDLSMEKRVNPMPAKRVKVVSFWSGIKKANSNGEATFDINIPQFSGELRLMAVSYKGQNFGAAENTMTVADPIVISTALPRFLSPGDTVMVPVTLSNTTDKAATIAANIQVDGAIKVSSVNSQQLTINPKSEGRAMFSIIANPAIGVGKVKVQVNGLGERFVEETEISVRPASTLQKITGSGSIAGGSSQRLNMSISDFIPSSVGYNLVVTRSPVMELGTHLQYLVQYPYGCTEQTVSAAFPQLYYGDMADLLQSGKKDKSNANTNVLEAIRKIKMRQLQNGAVTLWDGEGEADWWATIYAAHFLVEARKAGFDVENSVLETMLSYLNSRLKSRETITYYYNRDQNKKIAPKEVAYGLYILALAGRTNVPAMNYYKANPNILALDSRYLLSAAYAIAGDKKSFAAMLPSSFVGEESVPQTGGSYYSDVRDEAISLNALIDVDPGNKQIPVMVKHVSDKLKTRRYLSTQERAFSFLAIGKFLRSGSNSNVTAEIRVDGKTIAKVSDGQWKGDKNALKGTNIEVVTSGNGRMYYFWEAEGISTTGAYKEEDSYIKVRRKFYDRFGKPLSGTSFQQNDLIIVGITLEKSYSTSIDNIVITDLLPAGFEIENPRTKEIPGMDWIKDASTPTSLDVRDDRIHFFVNLDRAKQTYYYAVRAVSPGVYKMGPVSADAMYNGEYHSYHGAGTIRVSQ